MTNRSSEQESHKDIQDREKLLANWAWFKFRQMYPNEKACVEMLFQYLSKLGRIICHHCSSAAVERTGLRTIRCRDCRKSSWFTAGTFFERGKKLRALFGAIWLWESGVNCSTNYFAKLANIATSTAFEINKKIAMIINEQMADSGVALTSKEFMELFLRRSRLTPAKEHPSFEQHAFEEEQQKLRLKALPQDGAEHSTSALKAAQLNLSYNDLKLYAALTKEPQNFDQLMERSELKTGELSAALLTLEIYNFIQPMSGEKYVRLAPETSEPVTNQELPEGFDKRKILKSMHDYVKLNKHGISRKDLQLYSAKYWTAADRNRWGHGEILTLCSQSKPIHPLAIKLFVTPLQVYVSPIVADRTFGVTQKNEAECINN